MGLETGTYINDLVATNPTSTDAKSQGDDHLRLLKDTLKKSFPGFTGAIVVGGTTGGSANTYTLTPGTALSSLVDGMLVACKFHAANTGASTLNISSLGAVSIKRVDGTALASGDLPINRYAVMAYDGTNLQLVGVTKNYVDQLAFSSALPAQSLGFLISNGSVASFSKIATGFAIDEVKAADVASAATVDLSSATIAGNLVHITGTTTITAITLGSGAERTIVFDGALTLTHNATTLILPGGANITTAAGDVAIFRGDGSGNVRCVSYTKATGFPTVGAGNHEAYVTTGNGHGSTNTCIRRFTTTQLSVGTDITYADSATNGATFTVNSTGLYSIEYGDYHSTTRHYFGISVNSNQLTTSIFTITAANRLGIGQTDATSASSPVVVVTKLTAGDVIRAHDDGALNSTDVSSYFRIRKVNTQ